MFNIIENPSHLFNSAGISPHPLNRNGFLPLPKHLGGSMPLGLAGSPYHMVVDGGTRILVEGIDAYRITHLTR